MNETIKVIIRTLAVSPYRSLVRRVEQARLSRIYSFTGQAASDHIKSLMLGQAPAMVCRLGTGELTSMVHFRRIVHGKEVFEASDYDGFDKIAGFFPVTEQMIRRYYERMVGDIEIVDLLGSWLKEELIFKKELASARRCPLPDLEPYYHAKPWSVSLQGKRVLVVHPFEESIRRQYARRKELFQNSDVLPEFHLLTLKAVQSLGNRHERSKFSNWFEALRWMEDKVSEIDFDVALIGCGAYGLPLAAHVKRMGRKAVHLGGATQILFGIIGKRWEGIDPISRLFNESWIRPAELERPDNFTEIEGGSYW